MCYHAGVEIELRPYIRSDGSNPFQAWFDRLNFHAAVKVQTALSRLEAGNTSAVKWFEGIGEVRIDWGPVYRVYVFRDGERLILLLGGGTKKRQRADIETAKSLRDEYKKEQRQTRDRPKEA